METILHRDSLPLDCVKLTGKTNHLLPLRDLDSALEETFHPTAPSTVGFGFLLTLWD